MQNSAFVGSPESFQKVLSANAKLKTRLRVLTLLEMPGKYVKRKIFGNWETTCWGILWRKPLKSVKHISNDNDLFPKIICSVLALMKDQLRPGNP